MSSSTRSAQRLSSASKIENFDFPSDPPCRRCTRLKLVCLCVRDGRCFECVFSGAERNCNARMSTRTDKVLKEQEDALRHAQKEAAEALAKAFEASARSVRLQKIVDRLRSKSRKKLNAMLKKIEKELENEDEEDEEVFDPDEGFSGASLSKQAGEENS